MIRHLNAFPRIAMVHVISATDHMLASLFTASVASYIAYSQLLEINLVDQEEFERASQHRVYPSNWDSVSASGAAKPY
jgi:hypothetical protein